MKQLLMFIYVSIILSQIVFAQSFSENPDENEVSSSKTIKSIEKYLEETEFSGAILVSKNGKILMKTQAGMANIEHNVKNTTKTKFRLASVSKQFTAMIILMLQENDKLKVTDSVCKYVPECPPKWQPISIHHLLTHTSGIPSFTRFDDYDKFSKVFGYTDQKVDRFKNKELQFTPGEKYNYSNSGYVLLGYIIEIIENTSFENVVQRLIFKPLKMSDSGYERSQTIIKSRASGYVGKKGYVANSIFLNMSTPHAAGALYSTVEDMHKWDQALYGNTLISNESLRLMFTPFKSSYAYGWRIKSKIIFHTGWINGFKSVVVRIPEERYYIVVLSNNESNNPSDIGLKLISVYCPKYSKLAESE